MRVLSPLKFKYDLWAPEANTNALEEKILKPIKLPTESCPLTTSTAPKPIITIDEKRIRRWLDENW